MIFRIVTIAFFLFFLSCSQKNNTVTFVSEKVKIEQISLTTKLPLFNTSKKPVSEIGGLNKLLGFRDQFLAERNVSNLEGFKNNWNQIQKENDFENANSTDLNRWFEVTGLLLETTGEARFATELEKIIFSGIGKTKEENEIIVAPYVFTKNTDDLFINIVTPSVINYNHTTKGKVKVEMDTNYPQSGKVDLKFGMTERRYIEVNIRIPAWAEGTTVTVKKVKYLAPPGGYCKIAKKWKEGDLVEIEFPIEKLPDYLKF